MEVYSEPCGYFVAHPWDPVPLQRCNRNMLSATRVCAARSFSAASVPCLHLRRTRRPTRWENLLYSRFSGACAFSNTCKVRILMPRVFNTHKRKPDVEPEQPEVPGRAKEIKKVVLITFRNIVVSGTFIASAWVYKFWMQNGHQVMLMLGFSFRIALILYAYRYHF